MMRHEERDELRADIYDLLSEEIPWTMHLVPMQKSLIATLMVDFIAKREEHEDLG